MSVTAAEFVERFPEFADKDDARIEFFIDDAAVELSESAWGDRYYLAQSYLAAHKLALASETESGNSFGLSGIASGSADGISTSFQTPADITATSAYWMATSYGREFLRLKRITFTAARVVRL